MRMSTNQRVMRASQSPMNDEPLEDIIDVESIDLSDQEQWLLSSRNESDDMHKWFDSCSVYSFENLEASNSKKLIDTRTWTRPKKRFSRMSFESILEGRSTLEQDHGDHEVHNSRKILDINFEEKIESVPSMLRTSVGERLSGSKTGHESLEAFMHMSESNGADSFINMEAPEFNETFNINTPRTSMSMSSSMNQSFGMADSQILTESMMQTSMFSDISDVNVKNPFANDLAIDSVLEHQTFCLNSNELDLDKTFTSECVSAQSLDDKINVTFTPDDFLHHKSLISNETFNAESDSVFNQRSYIIIKDPEPEESELETVQEDLETNMNVTYETGNSSSQESLNSFGKTSSSSGKVGNSHEALDSTYLFPDSGANVTMTVESPKTMEKPTKLINLLFKSPLSMNNRQTSPLESTFVSEVNPNLPKNTSVDRRLTFKKLERPEPKESPQLDATYNQEFVAPSLLPPNRFHTFRKNGPSQLKALNLGNRITDNQVKSLDNLLDRKVPQVSKQIPARNLSRLPQVLQKSNPNLPSGTMRLSHIPSSSNFGFNRQKLPSLTSKLYPSTKFRTASEQRLDGPSAVCRYTETHGSTESIESTQSTHSAPDLDDRLSVCSDSSHNSYCRRTMTIDEDQTSSGNKLSDRQILENTWVNDENSLPSPILKDSEVLRYSAASEVDDYTVKTSSPILSPTGSYQSLNIPTDDHIVEGKLRSLHQDKKIEVPTKLAKPLEMKSGLRPPSIRGLSGIPRPASRIPAPKMTRAGPKSHIEVKRNVV